MRTSGADEGGLNGSVVPFGGKADVQVHVQDLSIGHSSCILRGEIEIRFPSPGRTFVSELFSGPICLAHHSCPLVAHVNLKRGRHAVVHRASDGSILVDLVALMMLTNACMMS